MDALGNWGNQVTRYEAVGILINVYKMSLPFVVNVLIYRIKSLSERTLVMFRLLNDSALIINAD